MANRVIEQLDERIRQLEERAAAFRALREKIAEDPGFVIELQDLLLHPESNGILSPERTAAAHNPGLPTHERIKVYLQSKGNEWHSLRAIADGTNIPRNTVRGILYQRVHSKLFESKKTSDSRTLWRVKEKEDVPAPDEPDEPEQPPLATVPFGIGGKTTEQPTRPHQRTRPKPKWARS